MAAEEGLEFSETVVHFGVWLPRQAQRIGRNLQISACTVSAQAIKWFTSLRQSLRASPLALSLPLALSRGVLTASLQEYNLTNCTFTRTDIFFSVRVCSRMRICLPRAFAGNLKSQ